MLDSHNKPRYRALRMALKRKERNGGTDCHRCHGHSGVTTKFFPPDFLSFDSLTLSQRVAESLPIIGPIVRPAYSAEIIVSHAGVVGISSLPLMPLILITWSMSGLYTMHYVLSTLLLHAVEMDLISDLRKPCNGMIRTLFRSTCSQMNTQRRQICHLSSKESRTILLGKFAVIQLNIVSNVAPKLKPASYWYRHDPQYCLATPLFPLDSPSHLLTGSTSSMPKSELPLLPLRAFYRRMLIIEGLLDPIMALGGFHAVPDYQVNGK